VNAELRYRIVFNGTTTGEYTPAVTRKRFARQFRLDAKKVETIFSGKELVIKDNLTEEAAMNFAIKIAEVGCECQIVPIQDAELPPSGERRKEERRCRWRRGPRPGAIVSDRRVTIRRAADREFIEEQIARGGNIPPAFAAYKHTQDA